MQAASLLVMPMLEAGFEAGEDIVDDEALQIMVLNMFDPPEDLASARLPFMPFVLPLAPPRLFYITVDIEVSCMGPTCLPANVGTAVCYSPVSLGLQHPSKKHWPFRRGSGGVDLGCLVMRPW